MLDDTRERVLQLIENSGTIDGRFSDIRRLGIAGADGHFSLLFSARDGDTGRRVALKVFNPTRLEAYRLASFEREEQLLLELKGQPNIVKWIAPRSQFSAGGVLPVTYFAVELAVKSVAATVAADEWSTVQLLEAFRSMVKAVQRIHARGIAHRDLKPENYLVMRDGAVCLSDFGTARKVGDHVQPLAMGYQGPPGDVRYSAPELLAGLHEEISRIACGADIYALGAILFELLTSMRLGPELFDTAVINDLTVVMSNVQSGKRREIFDRFVRHIVAARPLPGLRESGSNVPASVVGKLETLYRSMAALDYRERTCGLLASPYERARHFEIVFHRIDQCLWILRHQARYSSYLRNKRLQSERRRTKRLSQIRRLSTSQANTKGATA